MTPEYENIFGIPIFGGESTDPLTRIHTKWHKTVHKTYATYSREDTHPSIGMRHISQSKFDDGRTSSYLSLTGRINRAIRLFSIHDLFTQRINTLSIGDTAEDPQGYYAEFKANYNDDGSLKRFQIEASPAQPQVSRTDFGRKSLDENLRILLDWYKAVGDEVLHPHYMLHWEGMGKPDDPQPVQLTEEMIDNDWTEERLAHELPSLEADLDLYLRRMLVNQGMTDEDQRTLRYHLSRGALDWIATIYPGVIHGGTQILDALQSRVTLWLEFNESRMKQRQRLVAFFHPIPDGKFKMTVKQNDAKPEDEWRVIKSQDFETVADYLYYKYGVRDLGEQLQLATKIDRDDGTERTIGFPKRIDLSTLKEWLSDETSTRWTESFSLLPLTYR